MSDSRRVAPPTEEVLLILERTGLRSDLIEVQAVLGDLRRTALRGYSVEDEDTSGIVCIGAAAIVNDDGSSVGGVSVTTLK